MHDHSRLTLPPWVRLIVPYGLASSIWLLGWNQLAASLRPPWGSILHLLSDLGWVGLSCLYLLQCVSHRNAVASPPVPDAAPPSPTAHLSDADAALYADLRQALRRHELRLCYQPIVSLTSGRLVGFEALIRWKHPRQGELSPIQFMPLVEATDLTADIDAWVLEAACRQMHHWQQHHPIAQSLVMSVNLSGERFCQPNLIQWVQSILKHTGLPPHSLKLEVTETTLMQDADLAIQLLGQLHSLGLQLSIDDFGTGYSSLSYLYRFPVDTLKIDRSFINHIDVDGEQVELVRTILMLAWNLGLDTIAEGIETPMQLAQLRSLRCTYGQGFLFSHPLEAEDMGQFLVNSQVLDIP
jgi:EAL domain-containing protein (putative c-di-GMP-specific phosphodiesterase class I)